MKELKGEDVVSYSDVGPSLVTVLWFEWLILEQDLRLPVGRPKRAVIPNEVEKYFSQEDWGMVWWKRREKLWFIAQWPRHFSSITPINCYKGNIRVYASTLFIVVSLFLWNFPISCLGVLAIYSRNTGICTTVVVYILGGYCVGESGNGITWTSWMFVRPNWAVSHVDITLGPLWSPHVFSSPFSLHGKGAAPT